jgi:hypothetical protein
MLYITGRLNDTTLIEFVQAGIQWRSTSRLEDETIAIAGVLDIDPASLLKLEGEERKAELWRLIKSVPNDILVLRGPKLRVPNFGWAPHTMLRHGNTGGRGIRLRQKAAGMEVPGSRTSEITDRGLVGEFEIFILDNVCEIRANEFIVVQNNSNNGNIVLTAMGGPDELPIDSSLLRFNALIGSSTEGLQCCAAVFMYYAAEGDEVHLCGSYVKRLWGMPERLIIGHGITKEMMKIEGEFWDLKICIQ